MAWFYKQLGTQPFFLGQVCIVILSIILFWKYTFFFRCENRISYTTYLHDINEEGVAGQDDNAAKNK